MRLHRRLYAFTQAFIYVYTGVYMRLHRRLYAFTQAFICVYTGVYTECNNAGSSGVAYQARQFSP